jgi:hypothetical protein
MPKQVEAAPVGAVALKETFGGEELVAQGDLGAGAAAAVAGKELEVRAILAERHPRSVEVFREKLLHYCKHPDFAEAALYCRKVGRKQDQATGRWEDAFAINFSIRFIEAAIPLYRNLYAATRVTYEDSKRLLASVQVYDAEANVGYAQDAMLTKIVERKEAKDRIVLGERLNSENKRVFLVEATKDEMRNVFGAERSKLIRDLAQKLMPFHVLAEARRLIDETNNNENARDPDAAKKKVLDKFASIGISADMLLAYLDRSIDALSAKDLAELAVLFNGLKEGDFTWTDVTRMKTADVEPEAATAAEPAPKTVKLKDRILEARAKAGAKSKAKPEQPPLVPEGDKAE